MEKVKFVIATESYVINKGLMLIINGMRNSEVVETTEDLKALKTILAEHSPEYLLLGNNFFESLNNLEMNDLFQSSSETSYILAGNSSRTTQNPRIKAYFDINLGRTETINFFNEIVKQDDDEDENEGVLSSREKTILKHVALGKSNKEISDDLFISIHTVITHRKKITAKLGIKSISGLTVYAIINGLVSIEDV